MHINKNVVITDELITLNEIKKQDRMVAYFNGNSQIQIEKGPDEWIEYEDFTIEAWVYFLDLGTARSIISTRSAAGYTTILVERAIDNTIGFYITRNGSDWGNIITSATSAYTWYHIAIVRFKETITFYLNSSAVGTYNIGTGSLRMASWGSNYLNIGSSDTYAYFYGYMKGVQIVRGYAKYVGSFIPPTDSLDYFLIDFYRKSVLSFSPPILSHYTLGDTGTTIADCTGEWDLSQVNPSDIDLNQTTLVPYNANKDGCIAFDGGYCTGPSQNVAGKKALSFNFFINTTSSSGTIIEKQGSYKISLQSGKIQAEFNLYGGGTVVSTSDTFVNDGVTHQVTVNLASAYLVEILIDGSLDSYSNFSVIEQIYKNSEILFDGTSNSTMLQLRCNNMIDDCKNLISIYGAVEPAIINDSPFATKSIYLNGNYHLEVPKLHLSRQQTLTSSCYPSAIDFTIELWVKLYQSPTTFLPLIVFGNPTSSVGDETALRVGFSILIEADGLVGIRAGNSSLGGAGAAYYKKGTVTIPTLDWTHIAVTCKDHIIKLYQDGVEQTMTFYNIANYGNNSLINCNVYTTYPLNIGGYNFNNGIMGEGNINAWRAGNIAFDDIRITRGAIYG
jgi:hypothetical protein